MTELTVPTKKTGWLPGKFRTLSEVDPTVRAKAREPFRNDMHGPWPLVFLGGAGRGKTCFGLCLLDTFGGHYTTEADWCENLRKADQGELWYRSSTGTAGWKVTTWELWREVERSRLFVLDELGERGEASDFRLESIKRILDRREGSPYPMATVVITNRKLSEIASTYNDPLASRLAMGTVVKFTGDDRRVTSATPGRTG